MTLVPLLLSLALSQGLTTLAPGQVASGGKVLASFPFSTTGCLATGTGGVDITRATKGTVNANGDGYTLTECQNNEYRVSADGLLVEPARTNYAVQSNTMSTGTTTTSPWSLTTATVATVAGAPMGGTWAEMTSTLNTGTLIQIISGIPSSTTFQVCVWAAKASGTGPAQVSWNASGVPSVCTCTLSSGGTCTATSGSGYCTGTDADLGTTPKRICAYSTYAAATTGSLILVPGSYGVSTGTTRFSGAQLEVGTFPTSLNVTTATAVARNADTISATVPAVPSKWCIASTFLPSGGRTWGASTVTHYLGLDDGGFAGPNAMYLNETQFVITDAATGYKLLSNYTGNTVGARRLSMCSIAGTLSITSSVDPLTATLANAGTGLFTTVPTTLWFGQAGAGYNNYGTYVKNLKICSGKTAAQALKVCP